MTLLSRRRAAAATGRAELSERQQRLVWRIAGLLLDYPRPETLAMTGALAREAGALPAPAGPSLVAFLERISTVPPLELAQDYVETFDLRRKHCLHLSYFAYGDTRKRGMALLRFKHAYKQAGVTLDEQELPDHLPLLLEFAAIIDPATGRTLLSEYQPVVELLRRALYEAESPYALLLDAIAVTMPELSPASLRRVAELAAAGPPEEDVGLEPYGIDPALTERAGLEPDGVRR